MVENNSFDLDHHCSYFCARFNAMASPCELLIETPSKSTAQKLAKQCIAEVARIEKKFSRYIPNNLCFQINNANGAPVSIDDECHRLLLFAQTRYDLSDGMFDLSSGVLRRAWQFNGSDNVPTQKQIDKILPLLGWPKIVYTNTSIQMPAGMEIDFGGIGKEYAVSRAAEICRQNYADLSVLINLGGDIQVTRRRQNGKPWSVGIENDTRVLPIYEGALATSGDAKRYLLKDNVRYSHILSPQTGWPVKQAPASITVFAPMCIQAGCLATLALLKGVGAEEFLQEQDVEFWVSRH